MKATTLFVFLMFTIMAGVYGQTLDFTFTAVNKTAYVKLDSIKAINRRWGGGPVIYWPDTTLRMTIAPGDIMLYVGYSNGYPVGMHERNPGKDQFQLFQSQPNPVIDQSVISVYVPEKGTVNMMVSDFQGHELSNSVWPLDKGHHSFSFTPGDGRFFLVTALFNGESRSIKVLSTESGNGKTCMLEYNGNSDKVVSLKASKHIMVAAGQESGILDQPQISKSYTFQFAAKIPCPGTPTVTYEGQVYNTVQVYSQCWLKENLNVGTMISGSQNQTNNGIREKYCYNNDPDSCTKYGGLYQWKEMMQYTSQQGARGLCPPGWHIPTDEEWMVLEGAADSQFGIGASVWDINQTFRGFDAGNNLKSISGWNLNGNGSDLLGFSGLPGGNRFENGMFSNSSVHGYWWTTTEFANLYTCRRELYSGSPKVGRDAHSIEYGESVRCLRNY